MEVFAGYSNLQARDSLSQKVNQNGWDLSVAANFTQSLGVLADFSNHYGTRPHVTSPIGSGGKGFTFLFGPQYSYRKVRGLTPFVHTLFGGIQGTNVVPNLLMGEGVPGGLVLGPVCGSPVCFLSETSFAVALGGGLDLKAVDHVWIRLFQLDYLRANLSLATQNDLRLSAGIVFRFGRR